MGVNNLKILYNDQVRNAASVVATTSDTNYPISNILTDYKNSVWRSTSGVSNTITVTFSTAQSINCVILPYTNLSTSATCSITMHSAAGGTGTTLYNGATVPAVAYNLPTWDTTYTGVNAYSYGGGSPVRLFLTTAIANVLSIKITLVDSTSSYIEVARVLAGNYWQPAFNTDFGITVDFVDSSSHSRSQAGNIVTDIGPVHKSLSFSLNFMNESDKDYLIQIMRLNSMRRPMYVSLFPNDTDPEKEYLYQIYGKLSSNPTITHPMYSIYTSNLTFEEI